MTKIKKIVTTLVTAERVKKESLVLMLVMINGTATLENFLAHYLNAKHVNIVQDKHLHS